MGGPELDDALAYFNRRGRGGQTFGACVYNKYGGNRAVRVRRGARAAPGIVTVTAPGFTESVVPACDGTYARDDLRDVAPGLSVGFAWSSQAAAGSGTDFPSSLPSASAPHFVALATSDALAATSPDIRARTILHVDWTVTGRRSSSSRWSSVADAGAGGCDVHLRRRRWLGCRSRDALLMLDKGSASYDVYSLHEADDGMAGGAGYLRFLVEMAAATPTGLAKGTLTLE